MTHKQTSNINGSHSNEHFFISIIFSEREWEIVRESERESERERERARV